MAGAASGEECVATAHFVVKVEPGAGFCAHEQVDLQSIVKARGAFVYRAGGEHGQVQVAGLNFEVGDADLVEHQDAGGLEPDEIVAVVNHIHAVGFGVADAYLRNCMNHCTGVCGLLREE